MAPEIVPDVFADRFNVSAHPYGCSLRFFESEPDRWGQEQAPVGMKVAGVRMTVEHLKAVVYLGWQHIMEMERTLGVRHDLPAALMDKITPEGWRAFWYGEVGNETVAVSQAASGTDEQPIP